MFHIYFLNYNIIQLVGVVVPVRGINGAKIERILYPYSRDIPTSIYKYYLPEKLTDIFQFRILFDSGRHRKSFHIEN